MAHLLVFCSFCRAGRERGGTVCAGFYSILAPTGSWKGARARSIRDAGCVLLLPAYLYACDDGRTPSLATGSLHLFKGVSFWANLIIWSRPRAKRQAASARMHGNLREERRGSGRCVCEHDPLLPVPLGTAARCMEVGCSRDQSGIVPQRDRRGGELLQARRRVGKPNSHHQRWTARERQKAVACVWCAAWAGRGHAHAPMDPGCWGSPGAQQSRPAWSIL